MLKFNNDIKLEDIETFELEIPIATLANDKLVKEKITINKFENFVIIHYKDIKPFSWHNKLIDIIKYYCQHFKIEECDFIFLVLFGNYKYSKIYEIEKYENYCLAGICLGNGFKQTFNKWYDLHGVREKYNDIII